MRSISLDGQSSGDTITTIAQQFDRAPIIVVESTRLDLAETSVVAEIKLHFDKLILFQGDLPTSAQQIDHLFGAGFHGIVIPEEQLRGDLGVHAVEIFKRGFVFTNISEQKVDLPAVEKLLAIGVIPVPVEGSDEWVSAVHDRISRSEFAFQGRLISDDASAIKLGDRIRLKFAIEMINLRQKLMVTEIYESFESSSL